GSRFLASENDAFISLREVEMTGLYEVQEERQTISNRDLTEESSGPKKTEAAANARRRGEAAPHQSAPTRTQRIVVRLFQITARMPNSKIGRPLRSNEHACGVHWILVKKNTYRPVIRVHSDATRVTTSMHAGALASG